MAPSIADTADIAKDVVDGTIKNAANPWWVIGFGFLGTLFFLGTIVILAGIYGIKPLVDAQIASVEASTEAIKSNAETNRQMAKAIDEIKQMDAKKMDALERLQRSQDTVLDNCSQALRDHQKIMSSIQECATKRPGT